MIQAIFALPIGIFLALYAVYHLFKWKKDMVIDFF